MTATAKGDRSVHVLRFSSRSSFQQGRSGGWATPAQMPVSRGGSEPPQQRQAPRSANQTKMTNSGSTSQRASVPRRSTRAPLHELPAGTQRKKGAGISNLESKLGHVQDELRKLKQQLVSDDYRQEEQQQSEVDEKILLEATLKEKEREIASYAQENASLKKQLEEMAAKAAAAWTREEETALKLAQVAEELTQSRAAAEALAEKLESADGCKSSLEVEMKKLTVQIDQWKKAADAAVTVLADTGGIDLESDPGSRRKSGVGILGWKKKANQK